MALNDDAVITAAIGYIYHGPVGTAAPTVSEVQSFDPAAGFTGWNNIGHTARDELPVFGFDGGDTETRGTWQATVLKEVVTDPASDYITFNAHQFDDTTLGLYYGSANASSDPGVYAVGKSASGTTDKALLIVIQDGGTNIGFHAPKVSIRREDSIELAVDEFAYMPLRATLVANQSSDYLFAWLNTFDSASS